MDMVLGKTRGALNVEQLYRDGMIVIVNPQCGGDLLGPLRVNAASPSLTERAGARCRVLVVPPTQQLCNADLEIDDAPWKI